VWISQTGNPKLGTRTELQQTRPGGVERLGLPLCCSPNHMYSNLVSLLVSLTKAPACGDAILQAARERVRADKLRYCVTSNAKLGQITSDYIEHLKRVLLNSG
jgi:hypothetical protein